MFLGTYIANLTGKNRIVLPKKFRDQISKSTQIVLTKGLDNCIWGFSIEDWQQEMNRFLELPIEVEENRLKRRYIFGEAEMVNLDGQGRFVIPEGLFKYAQLGEENLMVGIGDRFEIWSNKLWKEVKRKVG